MIAHSESYDPYSDVRKVEPRLKFLSSGLVLDSSKIVSFTVDEAVDIECEHFLQRRLVIKLMNVSGVFITEGYNGEKVRLEIGINSEYIHAGDFFIDRAAIRDGGLTVEVYASDEVTQMKNRMVGLAVQYPQTLETLVSHGGTGATAGLEFVVSQDCLSGIVCPDMYTIVDNQRDCLLALAQAAKMGNIWIDRQGRVNISSLYYKYTPPNAIIHPNAVIDYKGITSGRRVNCVNIRGENSSGKVDMSFGNYFSGCTMACLVNNFMVDSISFLIALNYYIAKNFVSRVTLRTRCDPTLEIGDTVEVYLKDNSYLNYYVIIRQRMIFDGKSLISDLELARGLGEPD